MKRVGIITFHKPNNYGANLQAFALQEFIRELGYEVKIIDYRNKIIENTNKLIKANSGIKNLVKSLIFLPKNISRRRNFEHFRKQNYCLSKSYTNKVQIENSNEKFDVYIAGSDQLWNTKITKIVDDFYTLNFNVGQAKKVSYATSLANVDMKEEEIKEIANIFF